MNTIKIAGVQFDNLSEELFAQTSKRDQSVGEIRTLDDWELVLAAGGEDGPHWS